MPKYIVTWEIDSEAKNPVHAAKEALEVMQDSNSTATCFEVWDKETNRGYYIDLLNLKDCFCIG